MEVTRLPFVIKQAAHTNELWMHARHFLSTQEPRIALGYRLEQLLRFSCAY